MGSFKVREKVVLVGCRGQLVQQHDDSMYSNMYRYNCNDCSIVEAVCTATCMGTTVSGAA